MLKAVFLALAGALGTLARYGLSGWMQRRLGESFPAGTLAVNLAGCFAIGVVMHLALSRQLLGSTERTVVIVGFLGGFTTFSAFGFETFELLRSGSLGAGLGNVVANVAGGIVMVWLGSVAPRALGM